MSEGTFLTRDGCDKLKDELKTLKTVKRKEIAVALEKARQMGDLSENAEYDSAKQSQAINEKRIRELEQKILTARILDNENISSDKAYIGATLKLVDIDSKEEIQYMLVTEDEADYAQGKISISSPVGRALLGCKIGDIVNIKVPAGALKYKIIAISRQ
ncbi:MAG: transcription elongation factor GreA [Candidatus Omnitrophota bacterium]|nr:transcription elongation factor GreA [Candidatus Omnitrophota bacterium]